MPQRPNADLIAAYHATNYRVDEPGKPFVLSIDTPSSTLSDLHRRYGVSTSAFITAWNPFSQPRSDAENALADALLVAAVAEADFVAVPGFGEDPSGKWPGERSLLVLGIDKSAAVDLARGFKQHAFLFAEADAIPRLVLAFG